MKIALALSGGGVRATVFHLGVLTRLARQSLIENITFLSTVSGGSLAVALVWACSGSVWPSSDALLRCTIPTARRLLTAHGLHRAYLRYTLLSPWVLRHGRAGALAGALRNRWSVGGLLSDLPDNPSWIINATCYESVWNRSLWNGRKLPSKEIANRSWLGGLSGRRGPSIPEGTVSSSSRPGVPAI